MGGFNDGQVYTAEQVAELQDAISVPVGSVPNIGDYFDNNKEILELSTPYYNPEFQNILDGYNEGEIIDENFEELPLNEWEFPAITDIKTLEEWNSVDENCEGAIGGLACDLNEVGIINGYDDGTVNYQAMSEAINSGEIRYSNYEQKEGEVSPSYIASASSYLYISENGKNTQLARDMKNVMGVNDLTNHAWCAEYTGMNLILGGAFENLADLKRHVKFPSRACSYIGFNGKKERFLGHIVFYEGGGVGISGNSGNAVNKIRIHWNEVRGWVLPELAGSKSNSTLFGRKGPNQSQVNKIPVGAVLVMRRDSNNKNFK